MAHEVPIAWSFTEIKQVFGEVTGKGLWVKAWFYDWILTETQNSTSVTKVIPDQVLVKIIGRAVRTFKPRAPFDIQVSIILVLFQSIYCKLMCRLQKVNIREDSEILLVPPKLEKHHLCVVCSDEVGRFTLHRAIFSHLGGGAHPHRGIHYVMAGQVHYS